MSSPASVLPRASGAAARAGPHDGATPPVEARRGGTTATRTTEPAPAAPAIAAARWLWGLAAALLLTAGAWWQWVDPRLNVLGADDARNHILRTYLLEWLVTHGAWYPRWVPDLFMGLGYPLFNYYAPGAYYLALAVRGLFRVDYLDAFRATGVVAALLAAAGAYALAVALWRRPALGVLAALALLYGPYAFHLNLYKRGDTPEALGLALLPWLLLAIWQVWMARSPGRRIAWMAAAAGVGTAELLVHNISALLAGAVAAVWVAYLAVCAPSRRSLACVVSAGALAAGLAAFFWLPAIAETYAVQIEQVREGGLDYRGWLLDPGGNTPSQQSPGNRQTRAGLFDVHLRYPHQLSVAPKISLAQVGLGLLAIGSLAWLAGGEVWRRGRVGNGRPTTDDRRPQLNRSSVVDLALAPLLAVAGGCWFLTFTVSEPVWRHVPGLVYLQFPWRFLGPLGVCLALAGAGGLARPLAGLEARWGRRGQVAGWGLVALVGAAVLGNSAGAQEFLQVEPQRPSIDVRKEVADETDRYGPVVTSGGEFTPRDLQVARYAPDQRRDRVVFEHLYPEHDWLGGMVQPLAGDLRLQGWRAGPLWLGVRVANDSGEAGRLGIRQFRFPGWRAWVDGRPAPVDVAAYVPEQQAALGFITVAVPPGEHTVILAFGPTPWRLAGMGLTLAAALVGAAALAWALGRVCRWPATSLIAGWVVVAAAAGYLTWRGVRPMAPAFAAPPVPPARPVDGVWRVGGAAERLLVNVAEAVRAGQAQVRSPLGAAVGPDRFVDVRQLAVTDGTGNRGHAGTSRRQWLYLHPPSDVSVDVAVPRGREVWFQAALALDPGMWAAPTGDGTQFQALVARLDGAARAAAAEVVVDRTLNPRARSEDQRWVPVEADLSPWAGATIRLTLRTASLDDLTYDWAGWGNPAVVARESARPRPRKGG